MSSSTADATVAAAPADERLERLTRRLDRERRARAEAEAVAERGLRSLYDRQRELEILGVVSAEANRATSADPVLHLAVAQLAEHVGWPVGHVLRPTRTDLSAPALVSSGIWYCPRPAQYQVFLDATAAVRFAPGAGLPGRVLATGAPIWIGDIAVEPNFPRLVAAAAAGLRACFAVPVLVGTEVGAVLEFFGETCQPLDAPVLALAAHIGTQLGRVLERERAAEAARASGARLRAIFDHAAIGIALHDTTGAILEANPAFQRLVGYSLPELRTMRASELSSVEEANITRGPVQSLKDGTCERVAVEKRIRHKDGTIRRCALTVSRVALSDEQPGLVGMLQDVTEHRALEDQLVYRAYHDALTGLANRARFQDHVAAGVARGVGSLDDLALLLIDLDEFKLVNDTAGHAAGDALLKVVAERLLNATRGCDLVARFGGDEFAVLLSNVRGAADVTAVAERVIAALAHPIAVHGMTVIVGASIGIARGAVPAAAPGAVPFVDALLRDADLALYAAKARGRGQYVVYEAGMHAAVVERVALEAALRDGLIRGEFFLLYQPIVDLARGTLAGVEALVRWQHPTRGMVSRAEFIPLAEETGLIRALGRWVLEEACRQGAAWAAGAGEPFSVTVNVSGRQLQQPAFVDEVADALAATGFPAARLVLELTESTVIRHPAVARQRLAALKALGVRLAIDDFGTGYSALSYLRQFPIDVLKIDKSFVDDIAGGGQAAALAAAIVALGDALGLRTVAEGVESADQAGALARMGCALGQGYHFSRPIRPAALAGWMADRRAGAAGAAGG